LNALCRNRIAPTSLEIAPGKVLQFSRWISTETRRVAASYWPVKVFRADGAYRAGFATTQEAYEEAVGPLFDTLDWLEDRLSSRRFLTGGEITEADWRLFTTLVRFDPVYVGHFKCNIRRIADYPRLSDYMRTLLRIEGVAATVNLGHIKRHYYQSHRNLNPSGIVPVGPELAFVSRASAE